jgi:hypothetical protein
VSTEPGAFPTTIRATSITATRISAGSITADHLHTTSHHSEAPTDAPPPVEHEDTLQQAHERRMAQRHAETEAANKAAIARMQAVNGALVFDLLMPGGLL